MPDITIILLGIFCGAIFIQLCYYLFVFFRVSVHKDSTDNYEDGVSVIICARNEKANLEKHLPAFLNQRFDKFELIVVNDGSTDGTIDYIDDLERLHSNFRAVHLDIDERYHRGKKFALTIGIKAAKYDVVLLTDADCKPSSEYWIREMSRPFTNPNIEIVLGVGSYEKRARPLNWMIQLETFHSAMLYTNFSKAGMTYMGVGRNLAYRKELFFEVKGFASHQHILSGDDDLFVNETATKKNTALCLHEGGYTISRSHRKFGKWLKQKLRHYSTADHYRAKHKWALAWYSFSLYLSYLLLLLLLLFQIEWQLVLIIFGSKFLIQSVAQIINLNKLHYKTYIPLFFLIDLGIMFIHFIAGIRGIFSKPPKQWN